MRDRRPTPPSLRLCQLCQDKAWVVVGHPILRGEAHLCARCDEALRIGLAELQQRQKLGQQLGGKKEVGVPKGADQRLVELLAGLAQYQVRVRIEAVARRFGFIGPVERQVVEGHLRRDPYAGTTWSAHPYGMLALYDQPTARDPLHMLDEYVLVGTRRVWCVDNLLVLSVPKVLWDAPVA